MTAGEARRVLLEQHGRLRRSLQELEQLARAAAAGGDASRLRPRTLALGELVRDHNLDEERLLQPLLADLDAWGPARIERLLAHHADEHAALHRALAEAASSELPEWERVRAVLALVRELSDHIGLEERELLAENVLRDDLVTDGFGG